MEVKMTSEGNFKHTESFLKRIIHKDYYQVLENYAKEGVRYLQIATPKDTGKTAASWSYEIINSDSGVTVSWINDNYINGYYYGASGRVPLVIVLINGHATSSGRYIPPNDFVSPTLAPVIVKMKDAVWSEVTK